MLKINDREVHVRVDGDPTMPTIVLVHGFASSVHWWDGVASDLADRFHVVRIDLAGHGCTGGTTDFEPEAQARLLVGVLEHLNVTAATAVGHSFGADVVLAAARQSDRISKLVIVDQAPDYSFTDLPAVLMFPMTSAVASLAHRFLPPPVVAKALLVAFAPDYNAVAGSRQFVRDHAAMAPGFYRVVTSDRKRRLQAHPLDEQVRSLGLPTLAVHGRLDQMYNCDETLRRYAAAGAATAVIETAGHSPNVETPVELAGIISSFAIAGRIEVAG